MSSGHLLAVISTRLLAQLDSIHLRKDTTFCGSLHNFRHIWKSYQLPIRLKTLEITICIDSEFLSALLHSSNLETFYWNAENGCNDDFHSDIWTILKKHSRNSLKVWNFLPIQLILFNLFRSFVFYSMSLYPVNLVHLFMISYPAV